MPRTPSPTSPDPTTADLPPSVTALVEAARRQEERAWAELFGRYEALVRGIAAGYRLQEADAADAVQNTWLRAVESLGDVLEPEKLGGWLRTTARRECVEILRRARRERPTDFGLDDLAATDRGPEAAALDTEAHDIVGSAVARLPGRRRELIHTLFYRPGGGYAEMSREIDIPVGSIGPTRRRALSSLRTDLARVGYLEGRVPA